MILVDTSIWIDHINTSVPALESALEFGEVLIHPFVIGELACGTLRNRRAILDDLATLSTVTIATNAEVLALIENHKLMGKGLNYVDVHLLTATLLHGETYLWTRDVRLIRIAKALEISISEE